MAYLRFAIMLLVLNSAGYCYGQKVDVEHNAGLLEAHINNLSALRQFDALIRVERVASIPELRTYDQKAFLRVMVDLDKGLFLVLHRGEQTTTEKKTDSEGEKSSGGDGKKSAAPSKRTDFMKMSGVVVNQKGGWQRLVPAPTYAHSGDLAELLRNSGIPDFRQVALRSFPSQWSDRDVDQLRTSLLALSAKYTSSPVSSEITELSILHPPTGSRKLSTRVKWEFSNNDLTPSTYSVVLGKSPKTNEFYRWKEFDNVFVPIEISVDSLDAVMVPVPLAFEVNTIYTIHWFSVNRRLDESLFDSAILSDIPTLDRMLDPKRSKATQILEPQK